MKKTLSIITAAAMLAAAAPMALAADADYEKLIPDVKNRLGLPEEYSEFRYEGSGSTESGERYSFRWTDKENSRSVYANVSAEGDVLNYYTTDNAPGYDYMSADDTTKAKAYEYVKKLLPSLEGDIRLEAEKYQYGAIGYDVYVSRNGIEYAEPIGSLSVKSGGELYSVYLSPVALPDEDISSFISAEDAYARYMKDITPEAAYNAYRDEDGKLVTFPVYIIQNSKALSAASGEAVDIATSFGVIYRYAASEAAENDYGAYKELNESEKREIARVRGFISREKAIEIAEERLGIKLDEDVNINLYVDENRGIYNIYSYSFNNYRDISVDAVTGDILQFHVDTDGESKLDGYDFSDMDSMTELMAYIAPNASQGYEASYKKTGSADKNGSPGAMLDEVRFEYMVNGIRVSAMNAYAAKFDNGYSFSVTPADEYKSAAYASPDTFIGVEDALKPSELELRYAKTEDGIKAVYIPSDFTDINAQTGKRVNYRNEEPKEFAAYTYSDIDNHWIKPTAEKLALAGIGYEGGEFKPEEPVTELLAVSVIDKLIYMEDVGEDYADAPITRRAAAELFVKYLGLSRLAAADVFKVPYSDTAENYGSIAILKGMGIIASDTDTFRPDDNITRAEFMQMLYNAMMAK